MTLDNPTIGLGVNADLMTLNSTRPWKFTASGSGALTNLDLSPVNADKVFRIVSQNGSYFPLQVTAHNTAASVVTSTAKLNITGIADVVQTVVKANATQTSNLQEWQSSAGAVLASISGTGNITAANLSGSNTGDQDLSGYLTSATAASTYLKLDASNDPITGNLSITSTTNNATTAPLTITGATQLAGSSYKLFEVLSGNETGGFSVIDAGGTGFLPAFTFSASSNGYAGVFRAEVNSTYDVLTAGVAALTIQTKLETNNPVVNTNLFLIKNYTTNHLLMDVNGNTIIGGGSTTPTARLQAYNATNTDTNAVLYVHRATSAGDYLPIAYIGGLNGGLRFHTDSAGNNAISTWATWDTTDDRWEAPATTTVGSNQIIFGIGAGTTGIYFKTSTRAAVTAGDAITYNDSMVIKDTGLVGIGTTAPSGLLHVKGTADDQQLIVQGNATQTTNPFEVWKSDNTVVTSISNAGLLTVASGVTSGGNVILNNDLSYAVKDSGGTTRNCLSITSSDILEIGAKTSVATVDFFAGTTTKVGSWTTTGLGIGLGASTAPATMLDIGTNVNPAVFRLRRIDAAIVANDAIGRIEFYAADTSTTSNFIVADIEAQATNTISTDINPGRLIFRTTPVGVAGVPTEVFRLTQAQDIEIADGNDIVLQTTTGTKIGTATTQKLAFFNATPVVQPSAYTQTYSTASKTHPAATAATLTDNSGGTADTTLAAVEATYTQATIRNNFADLAAMVNKNTADMLDVKKLVNQIIDDLQNLGLVA